MKTKLKTTLALIAAFCGLQLFAATPVAVWDGDFKTTTKGDFTLNANGNTVADDGSIITIGSDKKGVLIDWNSVATTTFSGKDYTVLVRYANLPSASNIQLLSTFFGGTTGSETTAAYLDRIGFLADKKGVDPAHKSYGVWQAALRNDGQTRLGVPCETSETTKSMAITYDAGGTGYAAYFRTSNDGDFTTIYSDSGLKSGSENVYGVAIGGPRSVQTWPAATGMKIKAVAIFNSILTTAEMKAYLFPSESQELLNSAYLWLDASDASTITRDGTGMVTKWASRNAGGKAATSYSAGNVNAGPTVRPQGLGGKNVVDFGAAGSQKDLQFDKSTTIRTIFMVAAVANNNNNNTFFLGDDSAFVFHRGDNGKYFNSSYAGIFTSGTVRRNGETVSNPGNVSVPTSYGVYTFVSTGNATASRICQDRNVSGRQGGKQVAELIIFNKTLSDAERDWIENYLTSKWMTGASEPDMSFGFDNGKEASKILGGTAQTGMQEWTDKATPTYTLVRGSSSNYAMGIQSSPGNVAPYNGVPSGMSDSQNWSVHASMKLAELANGVLFGISGAVWNSKQFIGVEYVGSNKIRVRAGDKSTKVTLMDNISVEDATTKYHSYLLTFNASASGTAESPYYTLYVDGVKAGDSGTAAKRTGYVVDWCVGNYFGGSPQVGGAIFVGAQVDDFAIWKSTCLTAEQAKGVAAQFPVWAPEYTATVSSDTNFEDINTWTPSKPAGGFTDGDNLKLTVEGTPTITFSQPYNKLVTLTINGTPKLAAGSSIFEDGCWQKTFVSVASLTAADATFADLPTGYSGAYGKTATGLTLRAQNKEVISINIANGNSVSGTDYTGLAPVQGNTWMNMTTTWSSGGKTVDLGTIKVTADGVTTTDRTDMNGSCWANNTYGYDATDQFLKGYLDDGGNHAQVNLNNIPYSSYDVIIYSATDTDGRGFDGVSVNGTTYTCGEDGVGVVGDAKWGKSLVKTAQYGVNTMIVKGLNVASLAIVGGSNDGTKGTRGGIAAIQIVCTGDVVEEKDFTATISESKTFSQIQWDGGKTFQEGSLNTATITVSGEASAGEVTITFDKPDMHLNVLKIISARPVKLSATEPLSMVSHIDLSECTGMATYAWPVTALASGDNANLAYSGGSAAGSTIEIAHNGGTLNLTGGTWTFAQSTSSTATTVNMTDITASYPGSILGIGMATYTVGGASTITTPTFVLSQEAKDRTSVFTLKDTAALTVTGNVNKDENTSSIMFGHWNGPTTFTIQDNATFTATAAQVLVGRTGNNHTININGGTFTAKGIKASTNAGGTNTLNLNGGTLVLGDVGITTYNNAKTIAVNVTGDSKIVASAAMPITQAISVSAEKTLTLDPNAATITVSSAITGSGNIVVHDYSQAANGRVLFTGDLSGFTGTITFENGVYDLGTARTVPAKITLGTGVTIRATQTQAEYAQGIASSFTGFTPNATITLTKLGGGSEVLTVGEGGTASSTAEGVVHIDQMATYADATLTNVTSTTASPFTSPLSYASVANLGMQYDSQVLAGESDTGVYLNHHPWIRNLSNTYMGSAEITLAIVGQMATSNNTMFVHFGHTSGSNPGIFLASGSKTDEVVVKMNEGKTLTEIATMTVPNAAKSRHVYVITKRDDGDQTTVSVYLDGARWKTVSVAKKTFTGGVQCGSDFGGVLKDNHIVEAVTNDTALLNVLRIYDRVIGPTEIAKYSADYPYTSPAGTSRRTFTATTGNWIESEGSTVWSYKKDEATEAVSTNAPMATSAINLTGTADIETTISANLDVNTSYEALDVQGAQKFTFVKAQGKDGEIDFTGSSKISCPVEIQYGALDISGAPLTLVGDGAIVFDLSTLNLTTVFESTEIPLTGDTAETDKITITNTPSVAGRTVALTRKGSQYVLTITMAGPITGTVNKDGTWGDTGVITWKAGDVVIAEPDWSVLNSATLVLEGENSYTLTYPTKTVPNTIAKSGTGTLGIYQGNNGKDYVVDAGTLKFTTKKDNGAANITVNPNGTFDLNGGSGGDPNLAVTLNGGKLANNGTSDMGVGKRQFSAITLTADSTVGGTKALYFVSNGYAANTLELGGHKLSKVDSNTFGLCNTTVKNGTLAVEEGTLDFGRNASTFNDNATLIVADGATLQTSITQGDPAAQTFGGTMSRWSSVTGSVVVANGALQIGNNNNKQGGVTAGEYKFGKSITVNSGKTLRLWIWATRDQTFNRNTKAILTTPVTLNGSTLYTQDGAYWFDSITVNGTGNVMKFNYNKSHGIGSLNGAAGSSLELQRSSYEGYLQYFAIDGGDFNGTLTVANSDSSAGADFWLSPKGTVLADATINMIAGGRPTYIVLRDDVTLGTLTGNKFGGIFGNNDAPHTVTLTQPGTYACVIKDISTGTSENNKLSVVISGQGLYTFTGDNAYTGTTTINNGATLDAALGAGLPQASTITIAEGGKLVVDLENFVTVTETSEAYHFSGNLPANALDIRNQDKYPWISIGTEGTDLGKVIIDQSKLPFTGLHIMQMLPKHSSKAADRDVNGRDSGWIDVINYGPTETNLANYKIVRSNIGKKVKSDDKDLARLCSYTLQKGETFRIYTSEEYETAEDYGGDGKTVAWFKTIDGVVTKLDAYEEGAIMVVPTKVNPKKYPMVRLYDYTTNPKGDVIDEIIVPCDIDDNMMVEVVASTNKLERRVVYTNGTKAEYGPDVSSLYGVKDVKGDLELMKPAGFAAVGSAYDVAFPINPFMTNGKAPDANTITGVKLVYRVFDPANVTVSNAVTMTSRTIAAEDPDVAKYGAGCLLWEGAIPAEVFVDANRGKLVQFRAEITDKGGKTWYAPRKANPDVGYEWYGVVVEPTIAALPPTADDVETTTDVCTNKLDTFLMFIDNTNKAQMDTDIDNQTLPYGARLAIYDVKNHTYYDNVRIDLRGQTSASFYKKSHGLRFNKVAPLVTEDPFTGDKCEYRKTSFIAEYGDPTYLRQTLALRVMRESGVKAPFDWPVRLYLNGTYYQLAFHSNRFTDEIVEDYYGLNKYGYAYKNVHQLTKNCGAEKKTPDDDNEKDLTVLNQYAERIENQTDATALAKIAMTNFNIAAWVNYMAAVKVTQEADDVWTNLGIYINKYDSFFNANGDDMMMPIAYDQNLSWGQWYYQDDRDRGRSGIVATNDLMKSHPFYGGREILYHYNDTASTKPDFNRGMEVIFKNATFREMLARRLRTLTEKYLGAQDATKEQTPVWQWMVAYTNAIAGDVTADHTKWKYDTKVIETASNIWVWETALPFGDGVEDLWANYIVPRRKHLYDTHAAANAGKEGYPAAGGGYATGSSALIPETQAATETFGKRGALYFTDLNGNRPGEAGFDISNEILAIVNTNNVAIDMSGWKVSGAVVATLKPGTVVPTNSVLWIVENRQAASKLLAEATGGTDDPVIVNLDKTLVDKDGNRTEYFDTKATDQLFLKDADGTPAITHEATIGTKYYITLLDAFNCAAADDIVALLTDINNQTPAEVKTSVFLYGDTNTLTGAGFNVADGATLTIASGQIANGALGASPTRIVLIGGKYINQDYSDIVSNQYHFAEIGLPEGVYTYQVVPGEQSKVTDDEIVLPVAEVVAETTTTNDTGVLAFSKQWLKEKGLATDEQLATTEGKKQVVNNLNTHQANNIQVWENKVLGLDGSVKGNVPVILPKQTSDDKHVTFKMADQEKVSTDSGAIVTYKVWMGSAPGAKDIGSSDAVLYTQDTSMELPKDGVRYYRLEVITTPAK